MSYNPLTGDGVQTIAIYVPGWAEVYYKMVSGGREAHAAVENAIDAWAPFTDAIGFAYYGFDPVVRYDDGSVCGTDGYPDAIGKYNPETEEVEWERA